MSDVTYLTQEGLDKLKADLKRMTTVERPQISQQIAEARDKGDLSENAEYDAAKEAQGLLEMKIAKLQEVVANARVIDESKIDISTAKAGATVRVLNHKTKKEMTYKLVSEQEANLKEGKISVKSPIGKGLIGKAVGDKIPVTVPAGTVEFEVLEISLG